MNGARANADIDPQRLMPTFLILPTPKPLYEK
jgi:hypothetical protein